MNQLSFSRVVSGPCSLAYPNCTLDLYTAFKLTLDSKCFGPIIVGEVMENPDRRGCYTFHLSCLGSPLSKCEFEVYLSCDKSSLNNVAGRQGVC